MKRRYRGSKHLGRRAEHSKTDKTLIAVVFAVALIFGIFIGAYAGSNDANSITMDEASQKAVKYINMILRGQAEAKVLNISESHGLYELYIDIDGRQYDSFITKDGKILFPTGLRLDNMKLSEKPIQTQTKIKKSNKPDVKVFVFTYCPYGLQFEKALLPVIDLLGDKADISIKMIGAMHGLHEKIEAKRQLCLMREQPAAYKKYLKQFIESSDIDKCQDKFYGEFGRNETKMEECVKPFIDSYLSSAGADASKLKDCMENRAEDYYNEDRKLASDSGVTGSPTLMINGVIVQSERNPEAIKKVICSAFENPPKECNTQLSTVAASPGFGVAAGSSSSASCG